MNEPCTTRVAAAAVACALALLVPASAADRALEIMREVDRGQRARSRSYVGAVEVRDQQGKVRRKQWAVSAAGPRGESQVLVRFSAPPEVAGVGLLTLNHLDRPAEQWLYTPEIKRDRRITAQEKSARFMGTDFSNEDMEEHSVDNYAYESLPDDGLGGHAAYKIRGVYKDLNQTQYSSLILWVRKDIMVTTLTEFYIGREQRKTLTADDWQQIQGIWTSRSLEMKDLAARSSTTVRLSNIKYNVTFDADWFTLRNLRKTF